MKVAREPINPALLETHYVCANLFFIIITRVSKIKLI